MQHSVHGPLRRLCVLPSLSTIPALDLHSIFDLTSPTNTLVWCSCASPFCHGNHSQTPTYSDDITHASPLANVDPPCHLRSSHYMSVVIVVVWAVHTPSHQSMSWVHQWGLSCLYLPYPLTTPTAGHVDPWVFAYPYPHLCKPVPMRYGYGFGWVRVWCGGYSGLLMRWMKGRLDRNKRIDIK